MYVIGVDEAGRGPLAGPVSVGIACVSPQFDWNLLSGVNDSKQLTERKREEIYTRTRELSQAGLLEYSVSLVSARVIDRIGITAAVRLGIKRCFDRLAKDPSTVSVKLDGLLKAPSEYMLQETIVKGDQKEKVIGLASIMAKVTRDRYMVRKGKEFPLYGFEVHKGYGTQKHITAIKQYGVSDFHRRSFTLRFI